MVWQDYVIEGDKIVLTRKEIEEARTHYLKCADKYKPKPKSVNIKFHYGFYIGKADVMTDILKMFDILEG